MKQTGHVEAIYIYPERRGPASEQQAIEVIKEVGLRGDQRRNPRRAVTLLSLEAWGRAQAELGRVLAPNTRRANLLVQGIDLALTVGKRLRIGEVELLINGETTPCSLMDELSPGLKAALGPEMRGGVFGSVLVDGTISRDDAVEVLEAEG